jgi:2-polyprenyl-3-methyl-5-hydroxy-6-metoxy-1,4-benzoquinol methylase
VITDVEIPESGVTVYERRRWARLEDYLLFLRSKKAYVFASPYCEDKVVLDFGSGGGYGLIHLSKYAKKVIGVDIDQTAVDYCKKHITAPNVDVLKIAGDYSLPFRDNSFDVIVTFQVIEHVSEVLEYLKSLKRVLKPRGTLLLSTPNRKSRLLPFQKPWNDEHIREYTGRQLRKTLGRVFNEIDILGLYGTEEINAIEYGRIRQYRLAARVKRPIKTVLKAVLPAPVIGALKRTKNAFNCAEPDILEEDYEAGASYGFTVDDLTVGGELNPALDFLAICREV